MVTDVAQSAFAFADSFTALDSAAPSDGAKPSLSIGILTRNSSRTLWYCLKAIFSQGYRRGDLDVFLVDAGSEDETLEIAKQFDVRVYSEAGCTRGRGRNVCIKEARAEILVMLDSDIVIPRGWLSMVEKYLADPAIGEVSSPYYTPEPNSSIVRRVIYHLTTGWEIHTKRALRRENWVSE